MKRKEPTHLSLLCLCLILLLPISAFAQNDFQGFWCETNFPIPNGINVMDLIAGDIDADGDVDIAGISLYTAVPAYVVVFWNDGTGDLSNYTVLDLPTGSGPYSIRLANFGGTDSYLDLVAADDMGEAIQIFYNQTGTTFNLVTIPTPSRCPAIEVADFDGDTHLDIVAASDYDPPHDPRPAQDSVWFFLNNGDGTFPSSYIAFNFLQGTGGGFPPTAYVEKIAAADIDLDGDIDVALSTGVQTGAQTVKIMENMTADNGGVFSFAEGQVILANEAGPWEIKLALYDLDQLPDLIWTHAWTNHLELSRGLPISPGNFNSVPAFVNVNPAKSDHRYDMEVADANGDGLLDVLCAGGINGAWIVRGNGTSESFGERRPVMPVTGLSKSLGATLADLDGAGFLEVVLATTPAGLQVYRDCDDCDGRLITGDVTGDRTHTSADLIYMSNYLFKSGPKPVVCVAAGDANCDLTVNPSDIIYLVNYLYRGMAAPCDVCPLVESGSWDCSY